MMRANLHTYVQCCKTCTTASPATRQECFSVHQSGLALALFLAQGWTPEHDSICTSQHLERTLRQHFSKQLIIMQLNLGTATGRPEKDGMHEASFSGSPATSPNGCTCQFHCLSVSALVADISTPQLQPEEPATATATEACTVIYLQTLAIIVPLVWSEHSIVDPSSMTPFLGWTGPSRDCKLRTSCDRDSSSAV